MVSRAKYEAGFNAAYGEILKKVRSKVPSMFENRVESELPNHKQDIRDISNAVLDAAEKVIEL